MNCAIAIGLRLPPVLPLIEGPRALCALVPSDSERCSHFVSDFSFPACFVNRRVDGFLLGPPLRRHHVGQIGRCQVSSVRCTRPAASAVASQSWIRQVNVDAVNSYFPVEVVDAVFEVGQQRDTGGTGDLCQM